MRNWRCRLRWTKSRSRCRWRQAWASTLSLLVRHVCSQPSRYMLCWFNSFILKGNTHVIEKQLNSLNYTHGKPLAPQSPREGSAICLVAVEGHGGRHPGGVNSVTGWKLNLVNSWQMSPHFQGEETPYMILLCLLVLFFVPFRRINPI